MGKKGGKFSARSREIGSGIRSLKRRVVATRCQRDRLAGARRIKGSLLYFEDHRPGTSLSILSFLRPRPRAPGPFLGLHSINGAAEAAPLHDH